MLGYRAAGEGMAVVMLHSSLSSSGQWQGLVKALKADFKCINIDLLGYGDAPDVTTPEHYSLLDETQRVMTIVNHEIGQQPFILVGHSFGGAVGLSIAKQYPQRVKAMALYEPVAFHLLDSQGEAFADIHRISGALSGLSPEQGACAFVDYWNQPGFFAQMPEKVQKMFAAKIDKVQLDFIGLMGQTYRLNELALAHCPVLVIAGCQSPVSSRTIAAMLRDNLPNVHYREFDGGHMAPIQQGAEVSALIAEFIQNQN